MVDPDERTRASTTDMPLKKRNPLKRLWDSESYGLVLELNLVTYVLMTKETRRKPCLFKAWSGGFFPGFSQKPRMGVPQNRKKRRNHREKSLLERGESMHQHMPWQQANFCV